MAFLRPISADELAIATEDSLLRKPVVGWLAAVIMLAVIGFALYSQRYFFDDVDAQGRSVFGMAFALLALVTAVPVIVLRWLDRREPEPWFMYGLALLWGATIATGLAGDANSWLDDHAPALLTDVLFAPMVEEIVKALGLLALILALRGEFNGPRDGMLYGALIGAGFTLLETSIYIMRSVTPEGDVPWSYMISTRIPLLGMSGHALYTAITGTYVGLALLEKRRSARIRLVLWGLFLAILNHALWNSAGAFFSALAVVGIGSMVYGVDAAQVFDASMVGVPIWISWPAAVAAVFVSNFIAFWAVIRGLVRSGKWERQVMVEQLQPEVGTPTITQPEYDAIVATGEPPKPHSAHEVFVLQCNLAKRKALLALHGRPIESDHAVQVRRRQIAAARTA